MLRALCLFLTAAVATAGAPAAPAAPAAPLIATEAEAERGPAYVALKGRGFGHGRGMSQYGAKERAEGGQGYRRILRFYYPGLDLGHARGTIEVLISSDTGDDVVVRQGAGLKVRQVSNGSSWNLGNAAPRADRWKLTAARGNAATRVSYFTNRWHSYRVVRGEAEFHRSRPLALITPAGTSSYKGTLRSVTSPEGDRDTVNFVSLEAYLRGVVPREVPALWHPQVVRAQAVAARTYADYARDHPKAYYDICSSTSCQVYGGVGDSHPASDAAIRATEHQVLQSGGASAFTEFSSSNGGWTVAGGEPYPYLVARQDMWDPVNGWRYRLPATKLEDAYPRIGDFRRLRVLKRDGHGTWNGRVIRLRVVGSRGSVTRKGESFREKLSLRSTWWRQS